MKIYEVTERVNPETTKANFFQRLDINDKFYLTAQGKEDGKGIIIYAYDKESNNAEYPNYIGMARFLVKNLNAPVDKQHLEASLVNVSGKYKRKGIASAMYNFARKLENDILPSGSQTQDGKAFWAAGAGQKEPVNKEPEVTKPEPIMPVKTSWLDKVKKVFK